MDGIAPISDKLRDYWHPVAWSGDVTDKPVAAKLLDEDIVLWRQADGVAAFKDLCVHRGTRLSLGWVEQGCLVCPYHGWRYDSSGACVRIPAAPADRPVPAKAQLVKYRCAERYGLVFVCLGEPRKDILEFPEFGRPGFEAYHIGPVPFATGAARSFENFIDEAHFPWVHPYLLGDPENVKPTPARNIQVTDGLFHYEVVTDVANRLDHADQAMRQNVIEFHVSPPFSLYSVNKSGDPKVQYAKAFFSSPVSATRSVRFMVAVRNYGLDQPPDSMIAFTHKVWDQDRLVIESQRPEQVPIDFTQELHLREPDAPSIVYRRMLAEMGVTGSV